MAKIYNIHDLTYRMSDGRLMVINDKNMARLRMTLAAELRRGQDESTNNTAAMGKPNRLRCKTDRD